MQVLGWPLKCGCGKINEMGGKAMPETIGRRIIGLRERRDMTLEELAAKVGVNATTLGRMEKGQTQKVGSDVLTALAREFQVSADYLLGLTDIPDRKNYEIGSLGLSAQAVRNLYTGRVNVDVVNRLLEHPKFPLLTAMIAQYLDDTFAAGVAAQNELFDAMSDVLLNAVQSDSKQKETVRETARAVKLSKTPPHQLELAKIQNTFMAILKEMKRDAGSSLEPAKAATSEVVGQMMAELTKNQDVPLIAITPEQIVDAIIHTVGSAGLSDEGAGALRGGLLSAFESLPGGDDTGDS